MAVLGVLAALARALGLAGVELQCPDDGSGKLLKYFKRAGFEEATGNINVFRNYIRICFTICR